MLLLCVLFFNVRTPTLNPASPARARLKQQKVTTHFDSNRAYSVEPLMSQLIIFSKLCISASL